MNQNNIQVQIQEDYPITHLFLYKNKKFPIKYKFFKHSSKYFVDHKSEILENKIIPLIDHKEEDKIEFTDEAINSFINYVHHQPISLTKENSFQLYYLGYKYSIDQLVKVAYQYIFDNHKQLFLTILSTFQNDQNFDIFPYEEAVSNNFLDFIRDEKLLNINIPILYRILDKHTSIHGREENNDIILTFLFKYLDKHGKKASPLFEFVNFNQEYFNLLFTEYKNKFDFNYLNSYINKSMADAQFLLTRKIKDDNMTKIKEQEIEIKKLKEELNKLKYDIQNYNEFSQKIESNMNIYKANFDGDLSGSATNGEYFVFVTYEKDFNNILIYYSKNPEIGFITKRINCYQSNCTAFVSKIEYVKGEFVIIYLLQNKNKVDIYAIHTKNPAAEWQKHQIYTAYSIESINDSISFYYLNNTYIITFRTDKSSSKRTFGIIFNKNLTSTFAGNFKMTFDDDVWSMIVGYGENKWAFAFSFSKKKNPNDYYNSIVNKACIYSSNDIQSLSLDSNCNILFEQSYNICQIVSIHFNGKYWIAIGSHKLYGANIYYSKSLSEPFINYSLDEYYDANYSSLKLFHKKSLFFACKNKSLYAIFTCDESPEKWNSIKICDVTTGSTHFLSIFEPSKTLFCASLTYDNLYKVLVLWKKI